MQYMMELKDILCDELAQITNKVKQEQLTSGSLDMIDKLTHSIKSVETVLAMNGYSHDYRPTYGTYEGSYRNRDSMGRFSNDSYASRDNLRNDIMAKLNQYEMMK